MIPPLFEGLCDDAALFPPGNAPLDAALRQHLTYRASDFAALVGPFVFPIPRLTELASPPSPISVSLTAPGGPATVAAALDIVEAIDDITVVAVEIALISADFEVGILDALPSGLDVYIEIPRGDDRPAVFDIVAERGFHAKFRTGGITSDLYPGESELATAIHTAMTRKIRFKATAGLHHAVRNTDCRTGFEQHGFLNVLLAAQAVSDGAAVSDLEQILAQRDAAVIVEEILTITQPRTFGSFGTCDIAEPFGDLVSLALTKDYC